MPRFFCGVSPWAAEAYRPLVFSTLRMSLISTHCYANRNIPHDWHMWLLHCNLEWRRNSLRCERHGEVCFWHYWSVLQAQQLLVLCEVRRWSTDTIKPLSTGLFPTDHTSLFPNLGSWIFTASGRSSRTPFASRMQPTMLRLNIGSSVMKSSNVDDQICCLKFASQTIQSQQIRLRWMRWRMK